MTAKKPTSVFLYGIGMEEDLENGDDPRSLEMLAAPQVALVTWNLNEGHVYDLIGKALDEAGFGSARVVVLHKELPRSLDPKSPVLQAWVFSFGLSAKEEDRLGQVIVQERPLLD